MSSVLGSLAAPLFDGVDTATSRDGDSACASSTSMAAARMRRTASATTASLDDDDDDSSSSTEAVLRALALAPWQTFARAQPLLTSDLGALVDAAHARQRRQASKTRDGDDDVVAETSTGDTNDDDDRNNNNTNDDDDDDAVQAALSQHRRELSALLCVLHQPRDVYASLTTYMQLMSRLADAHATSTLLAGIDAAWRWLQECDHAPADAAQAAATQAAAAQAARLLVLYTDALALYTLHATHDERTAHTRLGDHVHSDHSAAVASASSSSWSSMHVTQCVRLVRDMDAAAWRACDAVQRSAVLLMCIVAQQQEQQRQQQSQVVCLVQLLDDIIDRATHARRGRDASVETATVSTTRGDDNDDNGSDDDGDDGDALSHIAVLVALVDAMHVHGRSSSSGHAASAQTLQIDRALALVCCSRVYGRDIAVYFRRDGVCAPLRTFACTTLARLYGGVWTCLNTSVLWRHVTRPTLLSVARGMRLYAPLWAAAHDNDDDTEDEQEEAANADGDTTTMTATARMAVVVRDLVAYAQRCLWRRDDDDDGGSSDGGGDDDSRTTRARGVADVALSSPSSSSASSSDDTDDASAAATRARRRNDHTDDDGDKTGTRTTTTRRRQQQTRTHASQEAHDMYFLTVYSYATAAWLFVRDAHDDDDTMFVWRVPADVPCCRPAAVQQQQQQQQQYAYNEDDDDDAYDMQRAQQAHARRRVACDGDLLASLAAAAALPSHATNGGCMVDHLSVCLSLLRLFATTTSSCSTHSLLLPRLPHARDFVDAALALLHSVYVCVVLPSRTHAKTTLAPPTGAAATTKAMTMRSSSSSSLSLLREACGDDVDGDDDGGAVACVVAPRNLRSVAETVCRAYRRRTHALSPSTQETLYALLEALYTTTMQGSSSSSQLRYERAQRLQLAQQLLTPAAATSSAAGVERELLLQLYLHHLLVCALTPRRVTDSNNNNDDDDEECHGRDHASSSSVSLRTAADAAVRMAAAHRLLALVTLLPQLDDQRNRTRTHDHGDDMHATAVYMYVLHYLDVLIDHGALRRQCVRDVLQRSTPHALVAGLCVGSVQLARAYLDGDRYACYHTTRRALRASLQLLRDALHSCADDTSDDTTSAAAATAAATAATTRHAARDDAVCVLTSALPLQLLSLLVDTRTPVSLCADAAAVLEAAVAVAADDTTTTTSIASPLSRGDDDGDAVARGDGVWSRMLRSHMATRRAQTAMARAWCDALRSDAGTPRNVVRLRLLCSLHTYDSHALQFFADDSDHTSSRQGGDDDDNDDSATLVSVLRMLVQRNAANDEVVTVAARTWRAHEQAATLELLRRVGATRLTLPLDHVLADASDAAMTSTSSSNSNSNNDSRSTCVSARDDMAHMAAQLQRVAAATAYANARVAAQLRAAYSSDDNNNDGKDSSNAAARATRPLPPPAHVIEQLLRDGAAVVAHASDALRVHASRVHYADATDDAPLCSSLSLSSLLSTTLLLSSSSLANNTSNRSNNNNNNSSATQHDGDVHALATLLASLARVCAALTQTVWLMACDDGKATAALFVTRASALLLASLRCACAAMTMTSAAQLRVTRSRVLQRALQLAHATAHVHSGDDGVMAFVDATRERVGGRHVRATGVPSSVAAAATTTTTTTTSTRVQRLLLTLLAQLTTSHHDFVQRHRPCSSSTSTNNNNTSRRDRKRTHDDAAVAYTPVCDAVQDVCGVLRCMPDSVLDDTTLRQHVWSLLTRHWQFVASLGGDILVTTDSNDYNSSNSEKNEAADATWRVWARLCEHTLALLPRVRLAGDAALASALARACAQHAMALLPRIPAYAAVADTSSSSSSRVTYVEQLFTVVQSAVLLLPQQQQQQHEVSSAADEVWVALPLDDMLSLARALGSCTTSATRHILSPTQPPSSSATAAAAATTMTQTVATGAVVVGAVTAQAAWHVLWCALLRVLEAVVVASTHTHGSDSGSGSDSDDYAMCCSGSHADDDGSSVTRRLRHRHTHRWQQQQRLLQLAHVLLHDTPRMLHALGGFAPPTHRVLAPAVPRHSRHGDAALYIWDVVEMRQCTRLLALLYTALDASALASSTRRLLLVPRLHSALQRVVRHDLLRQCVVTHDATPHVPATAASSTSPTLHSTSAAATTRATTAMDDAAVAAAAAQHHYLLSCYLTYIVHDLLVCLLLAKQSSLRAQERMSGASTTAATTMTTPPTPTATTTALPYDLLHHVVVHELQSLRRSARGDNDAGTREGSVRQGSSSRSSVDGGEGGGSVDGMARPWRTRARSPSLPRSVVAADADATLLARHNDRAWVTRTHTRDLYRDRATADVSSASVTATRVANVQLALCLFVQAARQQNTCVTLYSRASSERDVRVSCGKMITVLDAACGSKGSSTHTSTLQRVMCAVRQELAIIVAKL